MPTQIKRAGIINKTIIKFRKIIIKKKLNDALIIKNGFNIKNKLPRTLILGNKILVYREKGN